VVIKEKIVGVVQRVDLLLLVKGEWISSVETSQAGKRLDIYTITINPHFKIK
jgi:hypothetical protein